jgi:predicted extracellular nuclease
VVTLDLDETSKKGFFLQAQDCDGDPSTSDGLFVYLGVRGQLVDRGDRVEVTGQVQEYYGMTELRADPSGVATMAIAQPLPLPVEAAPPFDLKASDRYFESLEGMSVHLDDSRVVGPTDTDSRTWVVRSELGIERVFQDDPAGTGEIFCVEAAGLYEVAPQVKTGDRITGLSGALDFNAGRYCLQLAVPPAVFPALAPGLGSIDLPSLTPGNQAAPAGFSIATFNLADLFDTQDDPLKQDTVLSAAEYQRRLEKRALAIHETLGEPEVLAVQEVENRAVLEAVLARPEIEASYRIVWIDGPDERGIDVALLLRTDRVRAQDVQARQG